MKWIPIRLAVSALTSLAVLGIGSHTSALAQSPQQESRLEAGLAVTVEMFCSETKLRTTDARIRWSIPAETLRASGLTSLAASRQTLDVTVYKNGFDKGLLVLLPISQASPNRPVMPQAASAQVNAQLRAFQIRLIEVEQPRTAQAGDAGNQMALVVENLEPGVNYIFRIAIDASSGRMVSAPMTSQAPVCPADMVHSTAVPKRKR